ncbi:Nuclear receptor-binding factor 2 [Eumeta japonica]|uniref:Nuclear receptor-binding factor 2 n=1 Tax=Eumeta variegata TaxID=151549 RepID=A0A4C1Y749_EUMVA|nr:Nuclear receptor-binding factor 2 [Eumeta japonica]
MENHPLNLAHQQHRRAEAHLRYKRFNEAMQCHQQAAELLLDAMKSTTSSVALESITLQHSYHLKQKDLIKSKKEQYERVKKAIDNLKQLSKDPSLNYKEPDNSKVQVAIYRAIYETDSLLGILLNKNNEESLPMIEEHKKLETFDQNKVEGRVQEKDQQTVVEELQILSQNLHSLVEQLVMQVEVLKDENLTLKERILFLEKERMKYLNIQMPDISQQHNFQVITDSGNEPYTSPVINPSRTYCSVPPQVTQQPHFDLSAFKND